MDTKLQNPHRTRYVLQERDENGAVTNGPDDWPLPADLGVVECKAWHVFRNALAVYPDRYTPQAGRRLVLLAVGGAR